MNTSQELKYTPGLYCITLNPSDKQQYFRSPLRLQRFKEYIKAKLLVLKAIHEIDYFFRIELSEPLDNATCERGPRLHVHGFIYLENPKQVRSFLLTGWSSLAEDANIKIKRCTDSSGWAKYCEKQRDIMECGPITNWDGTDKAFLEGREIPPPVREQAKPKKKGIKKALAVL